MLGVESGYNQSKFRDLLIIQFLVLFFSLFLCTDDFLLLVDIHSKTSSKNNVNHLKHQQTYPNSSKDIHIPLNEGFSSGQAASLIYNLVCLILEGNEHNVFLVDRLPSRYGTYRTTN